ncbi:MAG TPA: ABC transporter substrate-binding protein [Xanthobacteraceae bacterium]|nr:ABC transporter substrate-binding protein [Xanthobacteraceae bacterium]
MRPTGFWRAVGACALGALCGLAVATAADAQQMREATFIVVNNLFSTPAFVAVENGFWAQQGLDVKLKLTSSGRQVTQALKAGEAQLGHAALSTTTASARASGNMLKGVIPYYNAAEYVAKAGGRAIIGRKDRGIDANNPKSMEGKKIAHLTGSTNEVYLREWFRKHGLDISKSQLVSVPVENMPITIVQGQVDAIAPWEPYTAQAVRELGQNAVEVSRGEAGLVTDLIGVVAQEDWIKKNQDILEKFSIGIAQATQFIRKNPKAAAEIDTRYLDGLNVADAAEGMKYLQWDPRISVCNVHGLLLTGNEMIKSGLIKKDKPFEASDFYDDTVLKRVMAQHPELFSDLPPLPKTLAECKGQLS